MNIEFHKNFDKSYRKLDRKIQDKVDQALVKFRNDPFDKTLKNHNLQGRLSHQRAFSVTGDVRIIFEERDSYCLVVMLDVGTHNQVY